MLPDGWKNIEFGKLFDIKSGLGFKYSEYRDTGIPLIKIDNIGYGHIKWENKSYLPHEYANEYPDLLLKNGDILLALNRPITQNKLKIARVCENDIPSILYQRVGKIYGKNNLSYSDFFYYVFSEIIFDFVKNKSIGSDQPFISTKELKTIKLPLPPLPEQKKIAAILSTWDCAIEGTEKLLANSQQQKKALMQQLLTGKKRLPGFTGEWRKHRLSDFFVRLMQRNTSGNTNVVTISAQDGLVKQEEYFKKTVASETLDGYFLLENGDFAYNKSYSIGYPMGAIKRLNRYEKGVVTTLYICFRLKSHQFANGYFFEFYFDSGLMNYGLTQIAHEGGRAHGLLNVKPTDFMHLQVTVPSVDEQEVIAAVLTRANEEIAAIESDLLRLRQEKKALMQQLLTGKRRVKVD